MSVAICDPGLIAHKVHELAFTFKPARNPPAIKRDNSQTKYHPCLDNIQKQDHKCAFTLGRQLRASLHKACCAAYSVFTICSNNGYTKQLFCLIFCFHRSRKRSSAEMHWERAGCGGKERPRTSSTHGCCRNAFSSSRHRGVCRRSSQCIWNAKLFISLVLTQQLTICLV